MYIVHKYTFPLRHFVNIDNIRKVRLSKLKLIPEAWHGGTQKESTVDCAKNCVTHPFRNINLRGVILLNLL